MTLVQPPRTSTRHRAYAALQRAVYPVLLGSCRNSPDEKADIHEAGAPATMMAAPHTMAAHSKVLPLGE